MNEYTPNAKRYDPRMHSAEHILNQTMVRMFNCGRAVSAHIEPKKSKCDYRIDRDLTPAEIAEIEQRVNEVIRADLPIRAVLKPRAEAAQEIDLTRLPADAGETVRIVTVGDYDACPCSGEHAASSGTIGSFRIISTDRQNGLLRIRFRIGDSPGEKGAAS